jgi:hypothetical protein
MYGVEYSKKKLQLTTIATPMLSRFLATFALSALRDLYHPAVVPRRRRYHDKQYSLAALKMHANVHLTYGP